MRNELNELIRYRAFIRELRALAERHRKTVSFVTRPLLYELDSLLARATVNEMVSEYQRRQP